MSHQVRPGKKGYFVQLLLLDGRICPGAVVLIGDPQRIQPRAPVKYRHQRGRPDTVHIPDLFFTIYNAGLIILVIAEKSFIVVGPG